MKEKQLNKRAFGGSAYVVIFSGRSNKATARGYGELLVSYLGASISFKDIESLLIIMNSALYILGLPITQYACPAACQTAVLFSQQLSIVILFKDMGIQVFCIYAVLTFHQFFLRLSAYEQNHTKARRKKQSRKTLTPEGPHTYNPSASAEW